VSVLILVEEDCNYLGVGLAEVDAARIQKAMGLNMATVSVGEGDVPVRIDSDDAGESKEYGLESDRYVRWLLGEI
jgi:hypothetical protein